MSPKPKGRILRIKRGYNPNSSSVGSDIPAFLFSCTALVLVAAIASQVHAIIKAHFERKSEGAVSKEPKDHAE
ncbi:MAG: hypothetical protein MUC50_16550 [Myxococcota bacterium]|jgi:hypothetical protein|nr:hypothetical protein [Myxococcota bacterium]